MKMFIRASIIFPEEAWAVHSFILYPLYSLTFLQNAFSEKNSHTGYEELNDF